MKITKAMSRKQFAAAVVQQLEKHGISCVLVGGACVSIYTEERHASRDLDFISPYSHEAIAKALAEIGFEMEVAAWFHWNDRRSLIHALWVCEKHPVSLDKVKRWAQKEGQSDKLEQFILEYKKISRSQG